MCGESLDLPYNYRSEYEQEFHNHALEKFKYFVENQKNGKNRRLFCKRYKEEI